jgi:phage terminase large subunit-like protein
VLKAVYKEREGASHTAPLRRVNASQGKRLRAQPVAMRYEQGRVCHVGSFPDLEDQLTTWIPEEDPHDSPDRLDAMVHGIAHLMKRHDRAETQLLSPHAFKGRTTGEHPAIAARRRAQQRAAS